MGMRSVTVFQGIRSFVIKTKFAETVCKLNFVTKFPSILKVLN